MPAYYPVSLDVRHQSCLVVGGGTVALRKTRTLLDAGADVTVVAPKVDGAFGALKGVEVREREFRTSDLHGVFLVIVATDDDVTNRTVARDARDLGCLVNVVDCPGLSNFIVPATMRRGDLQVSISTGGASPALAMKLRERLEAEFGPEYADFVEMLAELRREAFAELAPGPARSDCLRRLADESWLAVLREKGRDAALSEMRKTLGI